MVFYRSVLILAALALFFTAVLFTEAPAATYRNDSGNVYMLKDVDGNPQAVYQGDTIQTYHVYSKTGLTKTADTPYFNPIVTRHAVSSTGPGNDQTVDIGIDATTHIYIYKVTGGTVTVFYEATANTPAVAVLREGDHYRADHGGFVDQLVLQFSAAGTCEVIETNEPVKDE